MYSGQINSTYIVWTLSPGFSVPCMQILIKIKLVEEGGEGEGLGWKREGEGGGRGEEDKFLEELPPSPPY